MGMFNHLACSRTEVMHLLFAWVMLSLAFTILLRDVVTVSFLILFGLNALSVGAGFLFHELAHKFVAQRYGHHAEFRAHPLFLLISLGIAFFGFIFVIPGGVLLSKHISKSAHGRVALVGPLMNVFLALFFFGFLFVVPDTSILFLFFSLGGFINAWLGVLNLLPFPGLDGHAVFRWDKRIYVVSAISALATFLLVQFFPSI